MTTTKEQRQREESTITTFPIDGRTAIGKKETEVETEV